MGTSTMRNRPRAIILTAPKFEDLEVYYPFYRLHEAGWTVDVATPDGEPTRGEHGYELRPDLRIDEVNADDYALLVLPGGPKTGGAGLVREEEAARELVRRFMEDAKPVAAICHGPYTLVSAGVVEGRELTSVREDDVPDEIRDAGGRWKDAEVVIDGNLVTSRFPPDLSAFMQGVFRVTGSAQDASAPGGTRGRTTRTRRSGAKAAKASRARVNAQA